MYWYRHVIELEQYRLVCTGMYNFSFQVSCTALYPEEDVLVRTSTYHLVLPCTRGTGFQMKGAMTNDEFASVYNFNSFKNDLSRT